jgi:excisionase family DNA binding protein
LVYNGAMEFLTKKDVAKILKVHPKTVERWLKHGEMKYFKLGTGRTSLVRIAKEEVDKFIQKYST